MSRRTDKNVADALEWSRSEEHANKALKSQRHALAIAHATIAFAQEDAANALAVINALRAQMYEQGWKEGEV